MSQDFPCLRVNAFLMNTAWKMCPIIACAHKDFLKLHPGPF